MDIFLYLIVASGFVTHQFNICLMGWVVFSFLLSWFAAIDRKAPRIVGSSALAYCINVPTICWVCDLSSFGSRGYVFSLHAICCLAPYLGCFHLCGECCGRCAGLLLMFI